MNDFWRELGEGLKLEVNKQKWLSQVSALRVSVHKDGFLTLSDFCTYVCLFIRDPVGPMVQHNLQEQYMHTSQVAHRQCLLTLSQSCVGTSPTVSPCRPARSVNERSALAA